MTQGRYASIDALRLAATFQMVQGHTMDAVLAASLREGVIYDAWTWLRGMTSVAFLFAAGASLAVVHARAAVAEGEVARAGSSKRVRRGVALLGIGYAMHVPVASLAAGELAVAMAEWARVHILQCIGVLLLVMEGARRLGRPAVAGAIGVLAVASVFADRLHAMVDAQAWSTYARFGAAYLSASSRFPLVPYGAAFAAGYAAYTIIARYRSPSPRGLPLVLERLAGETLVMYVFHVLVAYADFVGLRALVGPSLGVLASCLLAVMMLSATVAVGLAWNRGKVRGRIPAWL